jgi:hypothetical protein
MSDLSPGQIQTITTIVDQVVARRMGQNTNNTNNTNNNNAPNGIRWDIGVSNLLDSSSKMTMGLYDASDAVGDFKKIFDAFPGSTFKNIVGQVLTTVGQTGLIMNRSMMDSAKSGFTFSQNLGLYDTAVLSARMSLRDWNNLVRESGPALSGLGASANKSGLMFLSAAKALQEDPEARRAIIAGTASVDEFNNALKIVAQGAKFNNLSEAQQRKDMAESARTLVFELDMMAKLTGKSREKMAKEIEEQNATAQMRLRIASMTAEERAALTKNQAIIQQLPKQAQELLTAYMTGGLRNTRDRENAAAFTGTNVDSLVRELSQIRTTGPEAEAQRLAITSRIQEELVAIGSNRKRLEEMSTLAGTDNPFAQKMGGVFADLADLSAAASKRQQEALDRGEDMSTYIKNLYETAQAEIAKVGKKPETEEDINKQASQALNALETRIKDLNVGSAVAFTDNLNTAVGKLVTNFGGLESATLPFTTEGFRQIPGNIKKFAESLGWTAENIGPGDRNSPRRQRQGRTEPTPPPLQPGQLDENILIGTNPQPEGRGSKDVWGDWFGGKSGFTLIREQGPEAVVPQEKIGEFIKDMIAKTPSLLSDLQGNLKSTLSEARSTMPTTDTFKDMFNNIKFPELPTATEGTSTTSGNSFASTSQNTEVMTELVKGMNQLNMRVERLITAVEDGADKNVRATKTKGNVLA